VYSASRYIEPSHVSPSAIFVITNEDIRRSHANSVPEALRLAPGVQVGRVDANKWAVSMRGFNSREANKLLILVDGRSIYDPLFSGMLWESQDFMLEDIDRIEVIRGPGGTLWGANAFNGVINIVTRNAADTQGPLASVTVGDEEEYALALRYGFRPTQRQFARVYVKGYERDTGYMRDLEPHDGSQMRLGGFRWDWNDGARNQLRISGDAFNAKAGIREDPILAHYVEHRGRNVLARWRHELSTRNSFHAQFYYDHVDYDSIGFTQHRNTYDLELQHTARLGSRHLLIWGAGSRWQHDDTSAATVLAGLVDVLPMHRSDTLTHVFVQDTITIVPDRLNLTLGIKHESTDYASSEWLPNVRVAWTPTPEQTWWAAVSEATRVPSRLEADLTFLGTIRPGDQFGAEHVRAYEAGHRRLVSPRLWFDVALFYNDYDDLRTTEDNVFLRNFMHGHSRGAEIAVRWEPAARWQLDATYTYLVMSLGLGPQSTSGEGQARFIEGLAARNRASLRTTYMFRDYLQANALLRYVDHLPTLNYPSYTELDLGLTWGVSETLELSLVGQNLLHSHHPEQSFAFSATGMATEIERSVFGRVTWRP
ncbi:MAG TPA: TonB-dependent receptor, partial [Steroidobacteraceae bacterium]